MPIEEELTLDIAGALRGVDRVGDALDRAATAFRNDLNRAIAGADGKVTVDIDAASIRRDIDRALAAAAQDVTLTVDGPALTRDINAAIGRADTSLRFSVDALGVTAAINAAVARANTSVTITGNAANVTAAINGAVNAANTNVTINGSANIAGLDDAEGSSGILAGNLKTVAATLATFVGVDAILRIADASSTLTEAQTKVAAVFGESAQAAEDFAADASSAIGQSRSQALEAVGTFGNFFTSSGIAQQRAVEMSITLDTLASDLASFNNIDPSEGIQKLSAGLAGEAEPLRRIGISLTEAEVNAKALELGLVDLGEELSSQDKILARYELILEKSSNAQGDFARTSDGLANQQRILRAQFEDILTVVGAPLVSPLLSVLQTLVPAAGSAADAFGRVVGAILPAVDALVQGAGPALDAVFQALGDTADELAPALFEVGEAAGAVIGAATPLIELLATLLVGVVDTASAVLEFNDGLGVVIVAIPLLVAVLLSIAAPALAAAGGIAGLTISLQALFFSIAANPIGILIAGLSAIAVTLAGLNATADDSTGILEAVTDAAKAVDSQFSSSSDSIYAQARAITLLDQDFAKFIETQSTFSTDDQTLALSQLGISLVDLRKMLQDGGEGLNDFTAAAVEAGQVEIKIDGVVQTAEQIKSLDTNISALVVSGNAQIDGNEDLIASFQNQAFALQSVEQQTFNNLIASGQLSQAQADALLALPKVAQATDTYGAALRAVNTDLDTVNAKLPATAIPLAQQADTWLALSDAILRGTVTSSDYQVVADELGVSLDTVKGFADSVTESMNKFVENAVAGLPQASDAFDNLKTGLERGTDPQQVITNLDIQTASIRTFVDNIAKIREASPEAADFLLGLGEAAAGPFAQDLVDGTVSVEEFQAALANNQAALDDAETAIRDSALDEAAYQLGASASEELGLGLDFSGTTQTQIDNVTSTLEAAAASNGAPVRAADQLGAAIGQELTEAMKQKLGINSPSQVAIDLGEQVARGLAIGLGRNGPVLDAASGLAGSSLPGISNSTDRSTTSISIPVTVAGVGQGEAEAVGEAVGRAAADVIAEVLAL